MQSAVAVLFVASLLLAGCSSSSDDPSSTTGASDTSGATTGTGTTSTRASTGATTGTGTTSGASSAKDPAPTIKAFTTSVASGAAPLAVNFTLDATDPEGEKLSWSATFGDGTPAQSGATVPATFAHTFATAGNFTVTAIVEDGSNKVNKTVKVTVVDASAPQEDYTFTGTATGTWNPELGYLGDPVEHTFEVVQKKAKMTVAINEAQGSDIDVYLLDPDGTQVAASNGIFPLDGTSEPDIVVEDASALGRLGTWKLVVQAGNAVMAEYTLDVTFE